MMLLMIGVGLVALVFAACTPSTPSYSPNPNIQPYGATNQYSFFGYGQIQYPAQNNKDATINRPDYGQGGSDAVDASGEGFVFDF